MHQSNEKNYLSNEKTFFAEIETYFNESSGSFSEKLYAFPRFVPRQALSYFLARSEVFQQTLDIHGSIFDFGIYRGGSYFSWLQLSAILEPYNHNRKVIGFDSFEGFSGFSQEDQGAEGHDLALRAVGGMAFDDNDEIARGVELADMNRPLGHVEKGRLEKGVLPDTCRDYLSRHPETIISLANFGLGLYQPTFEILQLIKPHLVKGSILVFEDLNQATWPGETKALRDALPGAGYSVQRSRHCPQISWVKIGE